ncbi:MAG: MbnH family di-heme enzyme [Myxococcota bacterium]
MAVAWGVLALGGCTSPSEDSSTPWSWDLPSYVPTPQIPADNPMTVEKVTLGRWLFHDFQLSADGDRSCAICHEQAKGFTDGFVRAVGTYNDVHPRNTLSVINVAWRGPLGWRSPDQDRLEEQLLIPLLGSDPIVEMGMHEPLLLERLASTEPYPELFEEAFPGEPEPVSLDNAARAIASYERTIVSFGSPYDRALAGDPDAMSPAAQRGQALFQSERLGCFRCHSGPLLDRPLLDDGRVGEQPGYFNTGLYDIDGQGSYPPEETGLHALTGLREDMGRVRTPSLRNVALTGPWGHDGSFASLGDVIEAYARGGRKLHSGRYAGDGAQSPVKDPRITGFSLTDPEQEELLAFLAALTDDELLTDLRYVDPRCFDSDYEALICPESE